MPGSRDDDDRPTVAVGVPWGSDQRSLDEFDPDTFDVSTEIPTAEEALGELDAFGHPSIGTELGGRYRLERILGRGACGVVFEASHLVIGKRVAVKCLYPQLRKHPVQVERFFQEARIAAQVEHPNVIQIFDGGDERDTLFLAMELLEGETLAERLERGPLAVPDAVAIFLAVLDAIAAVHDAGVVHRDLKPDNVFLTHSIASVEGEPKVLDFGVSKLKAPGRERDLTALGAVMGTPYYMAPEQMLNAKDVDARADVYSLGVMLYETIAGELPYEGDNIADVFTAAKRGDWRPLEERAPHVSTLLSRIIGKAMQVDREARFASVRDMYRALVAARAMEALDGAGVESARTVEDERSPLADLPLDLMMPPRRAAPAHGEVTAPTAMPAYSRADAMKTVELRRPEALAPARVPPWAIAVMIGLATIALASLGLALALLLL
ncbi:MAG: serine/threonine protein kinase [Sandaracinaceae bacterium]|nr:serine/threonine protein kinase [Sandaracinaceae bacterium]